MYSSPGMPSNWAALSLSYLVLSPYLSRTKGKKSFRIWKSIASSLIFLVGMSSMLEARMRFICRASWQTRTDANGIRSVRSDGETVLICCRERISVCCIFLRQNLTLSSRSLISAHFHWKCAWRWSDGLLRGGT